VSKFCNLIPAIDAIEAFRFWLKHFKPGWRISTPAVEQLQTGERYPIFVLYQEGVSVGVYVSVVVPSSFKKIYCS
jgi:hypothetical protein